MKRRISRRFQPTMAPGLDQLESRQLLSSGFQVVSSPTITGSDLSAVAAVSPTDIWAVGSDSTGPLIENFNGTTWSQVTAPNNRRGTQRRQRPVQRRRLGRRWQHEWPAGRILQRHILERPDNAGRFGRRRLAQCGDRRLAHRRLGRGQLAPARAT